MAGPFTETFTAATGTAVSSLTGWTKASAATSPVVTSNQFRGNASSAVSCAYYNTAVAEAHYAKSKYKASSAGASGPAVRVKSDANSCYYCLRNSDGNVYNGQLLAGAPEDWAGGGVAGAAADDIIELSIDTTTTTTVYYKDNGVTTTTYTSKSALSGGFAGVSAYNNDAGDLSDDWEGGDFVPPQYARPDADVTDGSWISNTNTATDLYSFMDETVASDTDFIETGVSTTGLWSLSAVTSVGVGTYIFSYRASGDASANLIAYVGVGTAGGSFSAVGSWTEVAVATAVATFAHTVTGTFSDTTKFQFKLEST